jgi:alpha-D-ribose 1-methylphosphonate 5-triphosphate synthase subunit PhnI
MYVAVKGGEKAISAAHALLERRRRGAIEVEEIEVAQIREQLSLAVDRVMAEGSLYAPSLAALAVKQAQGDLVEAIFLLRAMRTTLPRFGVSEPVDTENMRVRRRISATWKDLPGGQILGPTFDYTHRLLDFSLAENRPVPPCPEQPESVPEDDGSGGALPRALDALRREGIIEPAGTPTPEEEARPHDITRDTTTYPACRAARLQHLARGDEGFLLALAYSTQRGFGNTHPFVGEIRQGCVPLYFVPEELGFEVCIGEIEVTECETVNKFTGGKDVPPCFTRGYGLTFGNNERKAMSMALVDRALRASELDEPLRGPAQMEEFVLEHSDNVAASGFVQHLKLPHYVDFQAELAMLRAMRREQEGGDHEL